MFCFLDAFLIILKIEKQHVNLKPVVMTRTLSTAAAATTDPAINIKISAMLEKANSIRQVHPLSIYPNQI